MHATQGIRVLTLHLFRQTDIIANTSRNTRGSVWITQHVRLAVPVLYFVLKWDTLFVLSAVSLVQSDTTKQA